MVFPAYQVVRTSGIHWQTSRHWSPDGKWLASRIGQVVEIREAATNRLVRSFEGHTASMQTVAWSHDGQRLASAALDGTVRLWNAATGEALQVFNTPRSCLGVCWSPDGERVAAQVEYQEARVWDTRTGKLLLTIHPPNMGDRFHYLLWSPDGKTLAAGGGPGVVDFCLFDATTGKLTQRLTGHSGEVYAIAWSPDSKRLVTGSIDHTLRVWDAATGKSLHELRGHADRVEWVAWADDGRTILSSAYDGTVRTWDTDTGRPVGPILVNLPDDRYVIVSPEGHSRGSPGIDRHLVYVTLTDAGEQETLTSAEFEKKYGWKNDPTRVPGGEKKP